MPAVVDPEALAPNDSEAPVPADANERIRSMLVAHFDFVWRPLRRLGVPLLSVDDAAQEVFWIAARKIDRIELGGERGFLFGIAVRLASDARRRQARARVLSDNALVEAAIDPQVDVEVLLDQRLGHGFRSGSFHERIPRSNSRIARPRSEKEHAVIKTGVLFH
jgi:RNA polymerase sigma-70 factor (ECF subfamily)